MIIISADIKRFSKIKFYNLFFFKLNLMKIFHGIHFFTFFSLVTSHENSGNARGSLSSVGSDSPNPCNDNDGKRFFFIFSSQSVCCHFARMAISLITIRVCLHLSLRRIEKKNSKQIKS